MTVKNRIKNGGEERDEVETGTERDETGTERDEVETGGERDEVETVGKVIIAGHDREAISGISPP